MLNLKTVVFAAISSLSSLSYAQNETLPAPELVNLDSVVGGLYRPATIGPNASIAVFVMHSESDYISFSACTQRAERGYTVFCADGAGSKYADDTDVYFEGMMDSVGESVEYLRNQTDIIDKVVLFGHSGGGAMMSAYQNIVENGISACNGSEKIYPCGSELEGLPAADGVILIDANYGMANMMLLSLGPEIIDENSGLLVNDSLSVYNPANGFNATGASNFTAEFVKAFQSGVANRMQRILVHAEDRYAAIIAGNGSFSDDEIMYIPDAAYGVENNKLFSQDPSFLSHTVYPWPLLHKNESTTTEIVHTVRVPTNFGPSDADSYSHGAVKTSITRFLGAYALRAVPGIKVPLLTIGMTGHWEYLNAEKIYLNSGSNDTTICFVEGAQHTIDTCTEFETYPGEYGDTTKTAYDYMANWLAKNGRLL